MRKKLFLLSVIVLTGVLSSSAVLAQTSGVKTQPVILSGQDIRSLVSSTYGSGFLSREQAKTNSNAGLVLFRAVRNCSTGELVGQNYSSKTEFKPYQWVSGRLQMIYLQSAANGLYRNYTCGNRWQEQCINDGSFDFYYDEFCSRSANNNTHSQPTPATGKDMRSLVSSVYGSNYLNYQEAKATFNNKGLVLFRVVRDCGTGELVGQSYSSKTEFKPYQWISGTLQMIDLERSVGGNYFNYTCGNRWQEQCINDGSFDSYYEEFCSRVSSGNSVGSSTSSVVGSNILYRLNRDCATRKPVGVYYKNVYSPESGQTYFGRVQRIELNKFRGGKYTNYTCGDRYQEQCFNDGTFDSYSDEWCENE